jgi:hypothetical protein
LTTLNTTPKYQAAGRAGTKGGCEAEENLHLLQQLLISTDAASRGRGSCYWYPKKKNTKKHKKQTTRMQKIMTAPPPQ